MGIRKTCTIATTAMISLSAAAIYAATSRTGPTLSPQDTVFLKNAAEIGRAELEEGSLATGRTTNDAVRQFANRMITDHTANNNQLLQIAGQYNVRVPMSVNRMHAVESTKLASLFGSKFDTQYLRDQVKGHQRALSIFQQEASAGQNPDVRAFAAQTIPTLQDHLRMAQDLLSSSESSMRMHRMKRGTAPGMGTTPPSAPAPGMGTTPPSGTSPGTTPPTGAGTGSGSPSTGTPSQ